jgi:hypothetical protein
MERLSIYFSREEFEHSDTAQKHQISNRMSEPELKNAKLLCSVLLDIIREAVNKPLVITSGFRGRFLNKLVGGSNTSVHSLGCAADFYVPGMTITELYETIYNLVLKGQINSFDQVIWEKNSWVHLGIKPNSKDNRNQWLKTTDGKTYSAYPIEKIKKPL